MNNRTHLARPCDITISTVFFLLSQTRTVTTHTDQITCSPNETGAIGRKVNKRSKDAISLCYFLTFNKYADNFEEVQNCMQMELNQTTYTEQSSQKRKEKKA